MADREFRARLYAEVGQYIDQMRKAKGVAGEIVDANSKAGKSAAEMADKFNAAGKKMQDAGKWMSTRLTAPIVAGAALSVKAASDLDEAMSATNEVFGTQTQAMSDWADEAAVAFGMSKREALDSSTGLGAMFDAMDLGEPLAADMSRTMIELAGDLGSFRNEDPSDVLIALRSGLVGEAEPLRKFGVLLSAATVEQRAMEMGLADANGEVDEAAKVQARYALILENTTSAQGDYERTADGLANTQRTVRAQFEDTAASLGEQLLPIANDLMETVQDVVLWFGELDEGQQEFVIKAGLAVAAAGPLIGVLGGIARGVGGIISAGQALGGLKIGSTLSTIGQTAAKSLGPYAIALGALEFASNRWLEHQDDVDATVTGLLDLLEDGTTDVAHLTETFGQDLSGLGDVLGDAMSLDDSTLAQAFFGLSEGVAGITFGLVDLDTSAEIARDQIGELGTAIAAMIEAGDAENAARTLDMLVDAAGEAGITFGELIALMPDADQAFGDAGVNVDQLVGLLGAGVEPAEALATAMGTGADDAGDLAAGLGDVGEAGEDAAGGVQSATDALNDYISAQREAFDPVARLIGAQRDHAEALAGVQEATANLASGEGTIRDLEEADLALVEAAYAVRDASIEVDQSSGDAAAGLRDLTRDGLLTEEQMRRTAGQLGEARSEAEQIAGEYVSEFRFDVDTTGIDDVNRRLSDLLGRDYTVQIDTYTPGNQRVPDPGSTIPPNVRASGGPVQAGMPYLVGEQRAEVFVPRTSGRIIPSMQSAMANGIGGQPQVTQTFQATVVERGRSPAQDASIELRKLAMRLAP